MINLIVLISLIQIVNSSFPFTLTDALPAMNSFQSDTELIQAITEESSDWLLVPSKPVSS